MEEKEEEEEEEDKNRESTFAVGFSRPNRRPQLIS